MHRLRYANICRMIDIFHEPLRTCEYDVWHILAYVSLISVAGIVMEWVPNGDLMTYLEERGRLCKLPYCQKKSQDSEVILLRFVAAEGRSKHIMHQICTTMAVCTVSYCSLYMH